MRFVAFAAILLMAAPGAASAQGSLMDMGKAVLQSQTGIGAGSAAGTRGSSLSNADIASGLREALRTGSQNVVGLLGRKDGYNADPSVHVPLPDTLKKVQSALKAAGMSQSLDDLELRLNRAAEAAAPQAKSIFLRAVEQMSLDDARAILNGPQDSATQYFKRAMTPDLRSAMRPVAAKAVSQAGAVQSLQSVTASARGLVPSLDPEATLTDHVLDYGLSGIFSYLAKEEAEIRSNPAKRTSDILRKVFAQ